MPLNLLKVYNELLDVLSLTPTNREKSLLSVFNRDITNNTSFMFSGKQIKPTPVDGEIKMSRLFRHLTTVITDTKTRKREFEMHRSVRLHWIKYHVDQKKKDKMLIFSVNEPHGIRTYIYDIDEKYVIVMEPLRNKSEYYLLTAFHVRGKDVKRKKYEKKYRRRLTYVA